MTFIENSGFPLGKFTMTQKKITRSTTRNPPSQKEIAGFRWRGYTKTGGGNFSMVGGKSTLPEITFPIVGIGASAGDQVLVAFMKTCQKQIREIDVFARFSGDDFVLLLPEANCEQAYQVIEFIRLFLMAQPIDLDGKSVPITINSGSASLTSKHVSLDSLLGYFDQILYCAKESGAQSLGC